EKANVATVAPGGFGYAAHHNLVVGNHHEFRHACRKRHQVFGLGIADDVVGEENVIAHTRIGEYFDLAKLLAGDADGACLHLQPGDLGNLVRLDMRAIASSVPRDFVLASHVI